MNTNTMGKAAAAGFGSSVVDSNRFYSMLLDARAASVNVTETMHDVSEKILKGEKENAKLALDQLWALKKTLTDAGADDTLELLISYYQDKIDALRLKEEAIKKVSKETRSLIEEKRRKDEELSTVKAKIGDCARELKSLNEKLGVLRKREEELVSVEQQLKSEISSNESLIVNGLYEIILRQPEADDSKDDGTESLEEELVRQAADAAKQKAKAAAAKPAEPFVVDINSMSFCHENLNSDDDESADISAEADTDSEDGFYGTDIIGKVQEAAHQTDRKETLDVLAPAAPAAEAKAEPPPAVGIDILNNDNTLPPPQAAPFIRKDDEPPYEPIVYPKSVVRMGGKIIGEYYHDGNSVTKDQRHYIYNSRFMAERLTAGLRNIKARFTQEIHAELIKVTEDAASRVRENGSFHFEVSTNEILNDKNLKALSADLRRRAWEDAEKFASKLNAKIEALGHNYEAMLQEQMERCAERD